MAYGTAEEALSLFSWLKIGSGELSQDWDNKYNKKAVRLMAQLIKFYKFYYLFYLNKRWLNSQ